MPVKISIIIPVFNTESYLSKCLNSCINQTLKDIEIICINDGSKDNSLKILQDYAKQDNRIKIIDKKNEGVSSARNDGIKAAAGEYIKFVDSDDFLELDCCETAYQKAIERDADILFFAFNKIKNNSIKPSDTSLLRMPPPRTQLFPWLY